MEYLRALAKYNTIFVSCGLDVVSVNKQLMNFYLSMAALLVLGAPTEGVLANNRYFAHFVPLTIGGNLMVSATRFKKYLSTFSELG